MITELPARDTIFGSIRVLASTAVRSVRGRFGRAPLWVTGGAEGRAAGCRCGAERFRAAAHLAGADRGLEAERLTAREREVARLIARGYSNRKIGDELVIAERTAETHARNIREKLGLATRPQVAAWAVQQGLLDRTG